jgi:hypothetical protein
MNEHQLWVTMCSLFVGGTLLWLVIFFIPPVGSNVREKIEEIQKPATSLIGYDKARTLIRARGIDLDKLPRRIIRKRKMIELINELEYAPSKEYADNIAYAIKQEIIRTMNGRIQKYLKTE